MFAIRFLAQDVHEIREIDEGKMKQCGVRPVRAVVAPRRPFGPPSDTICIEDGSVIDVMVVYTPQALSASGGRAAMHVLIDLAMAEANTALANSQKRNWRK